jgi:hypothetical protein
MRRRGWRCTRCFPQPSAFRVSRSASKVAASIFLPNRRESGTLDFMSLKGVIEPNEVVDVTVTRQQHVSTDAIVAAVDKDAHDMTVFEYQHFATGSLALTSHHEASAAGAAPCASTPAAAHAPSALLHATTPVASPAFGINGTDYAFILHQLNDACKAEAVASLSYYRNMAFAAVVCDECGRIAVEEGDFTFAQRCAAASQSIIHVVAAQGSPTRAETLASVLLLAKRAVPKITAARAAARAAKHDTAAAELHDLW